jgi:PAS domain S-box-containing protein
MSRIERGAGYGVAVIACVAVLLIRMALSGTLGGRQAALLPFVLAVIAAAWWGGLGPGILATVLSALVAIFFLVPPAESFWIVSVADGVSVAIFVFVGLTVSYLCNAMHEAHRSELENQFRTLADSIAQLVWMAAPDGRRFWFNKRWYDYSGATLEQLEEDGWQSFGEPADFPRVLASWKSALAVGEPWEATYPLRRKDGQVRWHLAHAVPVRDRSGNITRWFGTSTDIQDRVAIEQLLKDADVRKDQFMAVLAHELRNPLSAISNGLKLWRHVSSDAAEMENLRTVISHQVQQLVRLIDDLLDTARITSGKIKLRRRKVDVGTAIARAVETIRPLIDAARHQLTVATPDEPVFVKGDLPRLTQVFANILHNAAKYTPHHGVISVVAEEQGENVLVRIRDNGAGIPMHLLTAVFDAFHQVDRTLNCSQGGLGIGLTLAKQLVELHGGAIEARSDGPGQGSEFIVTLPVLAAPPLDDDLAPRPKQKQPLVRSRILVVDDCRESAESLAKLLGFMGLDATSLYDGEAAIEWILTHRPDVVFLDIAMPGLDGYEVATRLREHRELRATVLVALTGFGQREDRSRASEAGFDFHVTKPADVDELEDLLLKVQEERTAVKETAVSCTTEDIVFSESEEALLP